MRNRSTTTTLTEVSARGVTIGTVSDSVAVVTLEKTFYLLSNIKLFNLEVITCAITYCMQSETNVLCILFIQMTE